MISKRIEHLRKQSIEAVPVISPERAELITAFYHDLTSPVSVPVQRALAFQYVLANKAICINAGELIVGEKGPAPKATPTYPELCCHSLQDLDRLQNRAKIPFAVSHDTREIYTHDIIPFWKGKTMRERIFTAMTPEWQDAYTAGIFTEFMEQRSPGHTVLDDKIYRKGMVEFKSDIQQSLAALNFFDDLDAYDKQEELKAMAITADALVMFAQRHAALAQDMAIAESDPQRKSELLHIVDICIHVPAHAPRDFWEALQYYWFVHLGVTTELNPWDSFTPGKLDQHLAPFYTQGLQDGTLTRDKAEELLQCFWIKFNNQPAPPKVGVTAAESGTYTDFAQINTGGVKSDGSDAVNDVTYLILDVVQEMRLLQPSLSVQVSRQNPDAFVKRAARIIRTGFGQPSVFNTDVIIQELLRQGKSTVDARAGGTSGCVETGAFGKENYNLTGYFNLPKVLEITFHNGVDPRTGRKIGLETGDPQLFDSFESLFSAFNRQLHHFIDIKVRGNNVIERLYARHMPAPFLSMLISDCIMTGKDYHDGGARYNTSYIQGVGIGSTTDALAALKYAIFETGKLTMAQLLQAIEADYAGYEHIQQFLLNKPPKYGNDDDAADGVMQLVFEAYFKAVDGRKNTRGGTYHIDLLPTTCHVYFGSLTGATTEGRKAWQPLSEGISPVQGADRRGPSAVIKSVAKMDHKRTGGTLLNQKFMPQVLQDDTGLDALVQLVRTYFKLEGHHIQFNVVDTSTLLDAQKFPDQHRDLIVRVAGYSDYFCDLSPALQDELIARTAHETLT